MYPGARLTCHGAAASLLQRRRARCGARVHRRSASVTLILSGRARGRQTPAARVQSSYGGPELQVASSGPLLGPRLGARHPTRWHFIIVSKLPFERRPHKQRDWWRAMQAHTLSPVSTGYRSTRLAQDTSPGETAVAWAPTGAASPRRAWPARLGALQDDLLRDAAAAARAPFPR